jgi:hypothetical protein
MRGGVTFLQRPSKTVTIPPHYPRVVFVTKTGAAVSTRSRCREGLPIRLRHINVLISQVMAVQYVHEKKVVTALEYHLVQLYKDLSTVLGASGLHISSGALLLPLGAAWKDAGPQYLDLVTRFVSKPLIEHIVDNVPKLWNFVVQSQNLGACPICHMAFDEHRHIRPSPVTQDISEEGKIRSEILRTCDRIG